jgi:hypothetical protein
MKEIYEELDAVSTDYFPMKETLLNNVSVSIAAGGMREMLYEDTAILEKRRGIFKMALETGTPLVPIVSVNENSLCSIIDIPWIQAKLKPYDMCVPIPTFKSVCFKLNLLFNLSMFGGLSIHFYVTVGLSKLKISSVQAMVSA